MTEIDGLRAENERLRADLARAAELRDYWHAETMSATRRIVEMHDDPATAPSAPADRPATLREAANGLAALGPVDSLVSAPAAWTEAIETLRRMADQIAEGELRRKTAEAQQAEGDDADEQPCGEGMCQCYCVGTGHPCGCDCPHDDDCDCPDCDYRDDL